MKGLSFVSRNDEVHQQSRNGRGPFPIGGTKSFATLYYTVVHWSRTGHGIGGNLPIYGGAKIQRYPDLSLVITGELQTVWL